MSTKNTAVVSTGPLFLVFLVLAALKLAEVGAVASWSWWWITLPLWGPYLLVLLFLIFGLTAATVSALLKK